jgi:hypothetical protein
MTSLTISFYWWEIFLFFSWQSQSIN